MNVKLVVQYFTSFYALQGVDERGSSRQAINIDDVVLTTSMQ